MRDHLPECPVPAMEARHGPLHPEDAEVNCICTELRACEERVRAEREADGPWFRSVVHECCVDKQTAYAAGLDAARAAVVPQNVRSAYLVSLSPQEQRIAVSALELAARAIDALREEQK